MGTAAAALAGAAVIEALARGAVHHRPGTSGVLLTAVFLALCATAPLGFLGVIGAATAVVAAAVLALTITGMLPVASAAAVVVAMYRLGWGAGSLAEPRARGRAQESGQIRMRRLAGILAAGLVVPFPVIALSVSRTSDAGVVAVVLTALAPAAAFAGNAAHARSEARVHQAAREAVARSLVEHTARGERARIARELHDVVAHHISMIAVQAETARLATPGMPPAGAERLLAIGDTARAGLTEMRRLLGVLREDAGPPDEQESRHPQPGLDQLLALVDAARRTSGATTRLIVSGAPAALDPGVELAAYRITQEALTNARRHAGGAPVDVELRFTAEALWLRVRDSGPGPGAGVGTGDGAVNQATDLPAGGHGVSGMRERATAVGGRLTAGPAPTGGFVVQAVLPAGSLESTNEIPDGDTP
ncbi:histidine kinase [Catenulispora acidiphila DSM 44928]|uniref:histidine kinase n=1 Tax=Catenulispora acidiphila (strain DSM 44928 / JCM 14897 / NBRC 102108 / NRRL B-24433 / ID139908) TaxID=479433 RepID=C7QEX7_CATAD|nr:sensor histidine kinase [Catenulispora acidiphila]ACU74735.1 histidine kinase [Catenulispora acidiphila DSM 44928]